MRYLKPDILMSSKKMASPYNYYAILVKTYVNSSNQMLKFVNEQPATGNRVTLKAYIAKNPEASTEVIYEDVRLQVYNTFKLEEKNGFTLNNDTKIQILIYESLNDINNSEPPIESRIVIGEDADDDMAPIPFSD